ncbi:hypothetical protein Ssi03_50480 [Sphaerisporangium siamense]|uniref:Uncharacterized protein n=1 Tax=Sphaerisporangium siamense TaxID=795645 RepID=A0A7W7G8Y2_9ACTN|nr:hypothetical protein [Sphaerisporangium siamense]MBB4702248.1 hypothetical protein [Sphaerisporangium siamense]GII87058.1 hypothetical protein Ssi03_50480 [Sphaerisporangium siamense]
MDLKIDDILGKLQLPEKSVPLCLRADLQARFDTLERDLRAAQRAPEQDSLAGSGATAREIANQIEAIRTEMQAHTVAFLLRALPNKEWSDLLKQHPPRKGNQGDLVSDYNTETFPVAALAACCKSPKMTEDQAGQLVDAITNGQWSRLTMAIGELNNGGGDIPFSVAASALAGGTPTS